jgi:membrane-associated HD superfamily phosphohydrolase
MKKDWKHEIARDLMAFGSIPFFLVVLIRSTIGNYMVFIYQLLIAIAILTILSFIIKDTNQHLARAFVVVIFTSLFYKDNLFTIFAFIIWTIMIFSAFYIKEKKESIAKGIILGVVAALVGYYVSLLL